MIKSMTPDKIFLPVVETFSSIQGESTHAGKLCFFIRLAGCNLKCSYCDTLYAQDKSCGAPRSLESLVGEAVKSGISTVEITGGEPALHEAAPRLAEMLLAEGLEVLMETNGSVLLDKFPAQLKRIIDVKLPSSNMHTANLTENYSTLHTGDELKFVVGSRADFDYALEWIDRWELDKKGIPLIFSCVFGAVTPAELVEWLIAAKRCNLRFQLQMHKFVWPPDARGV